MSAHLYRGDANPYAPVVVEDLLEGVNDWRSVSDVVRLTFKALSDVVKAQGLALSRFEQQLSLKANKQEVSTSLALKANISDVQRSMTEIVRAMEQKMTMQDVKMMLSDKVSKSDLYSAAGRPDNAIGVKQTLTELCEELEAMRSQFVSQKDLQEVYDVCATKEQLAEVEEALHNKANKQSVATALHRKANKSEVEGFGDSRSEYDELRSLIDSKVSYSAYERLLKEVAMKADAGEIDRLLSKESAVSARQELELAELRAIQFQRSSEAAMSMQFDAVLSTAKSEADRVYTTLTALISKKADLWELDRLSQHISKKADTENVSEILDQFRNEIGQAFNTVTADLRKDMNGSTAEVGDKLYKLEVRSRELAIEQEQAAKRLHETSEALRGDLERLSDHFTDFRATKATEFAELKRRLELKADTGEVSRSISIALQEQGAYGKDLKRDWSLSFEKVERELMSVISRKADFNEVKLFLDDKLSELTETTHMRAHAKNTQTELERHIAATKEALDELYKATLLKANIKDVCTLLDHKANADEVSQAFADVTADLDMRVSTAELNAFTQEQLLVNEVLCAENCVGRWIWKSGALLGNSVIPWEVQSLNTCPDNFLWEKDKATIVTVAPGLYQVFWGFFAKQPPNLQLLINGEPVFIEAAA